MSIKQKADEARKRAYQKVIATKLLDGIERLSGRASSKRRWIWELLQNAKDVANEQVRIEVVIAQNYVEFKHNGNPFSIENITYLIEQVSSKERSEVQNEAPKTTGKFGTGFMTTHLLSRQVEVKGILEDREEEGVKYKPFQVLLDRSATDLDEMIDKVDLAFSIFEELDNENLYRPLANYQLNQNCDTSFRYFLDEGGLRAAEIGLEDLQNAIAYTLAFTPTIQSVTVVNTLKNSTYIYKTTEFKQVGKIVIVAIEKEEINSSSERQTIACLTNESQTLTIAVEVEPVAEEIYAIKTITERTPVLFCEFPLVGSEYFPYPVVVNSPLFNPTEPRDGIWLNPENESKTGQNKAILEEATALYGDFLNQVTINWHRVHLLGKLKAKAKLPEDTDTSWYRQQIIQKIAGKLAVTPIVDTVLDQRIPLNQALIPNYSFKREVEPFAELVSSLYASRLPERALVLDWYDILKSDLGKALPSSVEYTLKNLLDDIAQQKTLQQLALRLEKSESETLTWLNNAIAFTSKDNDKLLEEYPIIPNQYDCFKVKKELYQDRDIPEVLKDILQTLDLDWRKMLVHRGILYQVAKARNLKNAVDEINKNIRENPHPSLRQAVYTLVSCFPNDPAFTRDDNRVIQRNALWNFARDMDSNVPDPIVLEAWMPNLWAEADLWLLQSILKEIQDLKTIESFAQQFNWDSETVLQWLDNFLDFATKHDSRFIDLYSVFPNQFGLLMPKKKLYKDEGLPEELKNVLAILTSTHWNDVLLEKKLVKIGSLFGEKDIKTVEDIAREIDKEIRAWEQSDRENDPKFVEAILSLMKWSGGQKDIELKRIFAYFYDNRAQLFLKTIDDSEVSGKIFTVLQHPEKLESFAKLAENPNISEEDLQDFAEHPEQFREFQDLRKQLTREVSVQEMCELVENQEKFETLKLLQNAAEVEETPEVAIAALRELGIYEVVVSLFGSVYIDEKVSEPTETLTRQQWKIIGCSGERGSARQRLTALSRQRVIIGRQRIIIGRQGEEFVYKKLVERFGVERVLWVNKYGEQHEPYDFVLKGENGEKNLYIDAKATPTSESRANEIPFYVSPSQWFFSARSDHYYIARVFLIGTEPEVRFLKFVRLLEN
jgi:hypothetical protein